MAHGNGGDYDHGARADGAASATKRWIPGPSTMRCRPNPNGMSSPGPGPNHEIPVCPDETHQGRQGVQRTASCAQQWAAVCHNNVLQTARVVGHLSPRHSHLQYCCITVEY